MDLFIIFYIKFGKQFKVNNHHLKLYLTSEAPTPVDMVNVHLFKALEDVTPVSSSPHRSS